MSYILDALRRADAERQRGAVPGLHDQPSSTPLADRPSARRVGTAGLVAAALLLLMVGGGLSWWLGGLRPAPPAATVLPVTPVVADPRATAAAMPAAPRVPLPLPTTLPPTTVPPTTDAARRAAPIDRPAAAATDLPLAPVSPVAARKAPTATQSATPSATPSVSPPAAGASAEAVRPLRLAELPDAVRRDLPALNLGGSVYADQAAMRMVIINGQVFHEGDRPTTDLLVQQIGLKTVVFAFRGQRFEMPL